MKLFGNWTYPTIIKFGAGRIKEITDSCSELGVKKPLLVTDKGLANLEITKRTLDFLIQKGVGVDIFSEVDQNPNEQNLAKGIIKYKSGNHDSIIAFGGGSGLDLGKMIAFMAYQKNPLWDFEDIGQNWKKANSSVIAPIIAVPTTAGTGSEVGRASVITNSITHEKKIIFHPNMLPAIVIADPELSFEMPKKITAGTGMDAFAHCLEAYCSPHYHPLSQGIALEGMRLVKENLRQVYDNPTDIIARSHMLCAASMGATAFQKGLGAVHALSHPIGALYNTHHGTTNAVLIPYVLEFNRIEVESKIIELAKYLNIRGGFNSFINFVIDLNGYLGIPNKLSELGVELSKIDELTRKALDDPSVGGNPVSMNYSNTKELLLASL